MTWRMAEISAWRAIVAVMTPPAKAGGFSEERLLAPTAASQATAQVSPCGHLSRLAPEGPIQALKTNAPRAVRGRTFRCQLQQAVPCPLR